MAFAFKQIKIPSFVPFMLAASKKSFFGVAFYVPLKKKKQRNISWHWRWRKCWRLEWRRESFFVLMEKFQINFKKLSESRNHQQQCGAHEAMTKSLYEIFKPPTQSLREASSYVCLICSQKSLTPPMHELRWSEKQQNNESRSLKIELNSLSRSNIAPESRREIHFESRTLSFLILLYDASRFPGLGICAMSATHVSEILHGMKRTWLSRK